MKAFADDMSLVKTTALTVSLVAVFLFFIFVYRPMEREIVFFNQEAGKYKSSISQVEQIMRDKGLDRDSSPLVTKDGVTGVVHEMMRIGEENKITFVAITLDDAIETKRVVFPYQSLVLDVQSDYADLGQFLDALNRLETGAVRVKSFDLARDETAQPSVRANLVVDIYLKDVNGGKR